MLTQPLPDLPHHVPQHVADDLDWEHGRYCPGDDGKTQAEAGPAKPLGSSAGRSGSDFIRATHRYEQRYAAIGIPARWRSSCGQLVTTGSRRKRPSRCEPYLYTSGRSGTCAEVSADIDRQQGEWQQL